MWTVWKASRARYERVSLREVDDVAARRDVRVPESGVPRGSGTEDRGPAVGERASRGHDRDRCAPGAAAARDPAGACAPVPTEAAITRVVEADAALPADATQSSARTGAAI